VNDTSGAVVKDAVAIILVVQVSGTRPPTPPTDFGQVSQPTNTFKLDVSISDGSVHPVEIQLR